MANLNNKAPQSTNIVLRMELEANNVSDIFCYSTFSLTSNYLVIIYIMFPPSAGDTSEKEEGKAQKSWQKVSGNHHLLHFMVYICTFLHNSTAGWSSP